MRNMLNYKGYLHWLFYLNHCASVDNRRVNTKYKNVIHIKEGYKARISGQATPSQRKCSHFV